MSKPVVLRDFCKNGTLSGVNKYVQSRDSYSWLSFKEGCKLFFSNEDPSWRYNSTVCQAVVIPKKVEGFEKTLLTNGDEGYAVVDGMPTVSYACLSQLLFKDDTHQKEVVDLLVSGKLKLLDFCPDEYKKLSTAEKKLIRGKTEVSKLLKPPVGFTPIKRNRIWIYHRSATCLFKDTRKNGKSYIVGQDDGSYFGCELPKNPETIADAFLALMPPAAVGKKFLRQGEWFFVHVSDKDFKQVVPKNADPKIGKLRFSDVICFCLPKEDDNSADHTVSCYDMVVDKNSVLYVKSPQVDHSRGDHPTLDADGWYSVHKNLAVRSVSTEGVD